VDEPLVPPAPREEPVLRRPSKYRRMTGILSDESLDSEALLDHRFDRCHIVRMEY